MAGCEQRNHQLALLVLGELSDSDERQLQRHLAACPGCRREYESLKGTVNLVVGAAGDGPSEMDQMKVIAEYYRRRCYALRSGNWKRNWTRAAAAAVLTGLGFGLGSYVSHLSTPVTTGLEEPAVVEMEQSAAEGLLAEMRFRLIAKGRNALKGG
jgi:anti-sigma factor RsiW